MLVFKIDMLYVEISSRQSSVLRKNLKYYRILPYDEDGTRPSPANII